MRQEVLSSYYPEGFLQQLGKELSKVVGLGDASDFFSPRSGITSIEFPVIADGEVLGSYELSLNAGLELCHATYRGSHPILENNLCQKYGVPKDIWRFISVSLIYSADQRADPYRSIVFPGFSQI